MTQKTFLKITGVIFAVIAILHVFRLILGWPAVIGGLTIPLWASWIVIIISGYLAYKAFNEVF